MDIVEQTTNIAVLADNFERHRAAWPTLRLRPISERKKSLQKLRDWIHAHRADIHEAMHRDFRKAAAEVDGIEIFHVLNEIKHALGHLDAWTQPAKVDAPLTMLGTRSFIHYEPLGICLIIAPWNYPFALAAGPLVSALAAGNLVVIKPSEMTPHVSALIRRMAEEIFSPEWVSVAEGGPEVSQALLKLPFDHIFFTGSPAIGKVVMRAAAEHLTSVTLELGGKSPTVVAPSAHIREAAKRIAVAKFVNNGQTCIAPDYVLVHHSVAPALVAALREQVTQLFTEKGEPFEQSASYCRIVNEKHFLRLRHLLDDAVHQGAEVVMGGEADAATRFMPPMILTNVPRTCRMMEEEIFGPILPVLTYDTLDEALGYINQKPKPLALYLFSDRGAEQQRVLRETSAGAVCLNECAIHFLHHNLPFGGVNNSGLGKSHGHAGFLAFSHAKPVLRQRHGFTSIQAFYPPYTQAKQRMMEWFLKWF